MTNNELTSKELELYNWHDWSLLEKIDYVKGSYGGFNLRREDIASLADDYREMRYQMKTIRMAVDIIEIQAKQLTDTQQALDSAVEALEEVVRWYGYRHDIPGTPLKDISQQKEPIQKAMQTISTMEGKNDNR